MPHTNLGGSANIAGGGDYITYTPPSTPGTDTFTYTIADIDGQTDSATVTVHVGDCGEVHANFQDPNGGSVSPSNAHVNYAGSLCASGSGDLSCSVPLYDDGRDAVIEQSYIDPGDNYTFPDLWVDKDPSGPDNYPNTPNRSELGF